MIWLAVRVTEYINVFKDGNLVGQKMVTEILGAYTDEQKAVARCKYTEDFVGPLQLDQDLPDEPSEWPGAYYPLEREHP